MQSNKGSYVTKSGAVVHWEIPPDAGHDPKDLSDHERAMLRRAGERHRKRVRAERDAQMAVITQMPTLGLHLKLERFKKRWHKEDLCAKANLSYNTICKVERGAKVSQATLEKVIETLGLNFQRLADIAQQRFN